jgi:hypothetical protein
MKAFIIYTSKLSQHPNYPEYSQINLTLDSLLKLREDVNEELVITDLDKTYYCDCSLGETDLLDIYGEDSHEYRLFKLYGQSDISDPKQFILIEIYNGRRL